MTRSLLIASVAATAIAATGFTVGTLLQGPRVAPDPASMRAAPAAPSAPTSLRGSTDAAGPTPVSGAATATAGTVELLVSGGHDTNPVDNGRPVRLIAAALGVPDAVFRRAFSEVVPEYSGGAMPSGERARSNKAVLMGVLAPHGITNERLDEVSNQYRYWGGDGGIWQHVDARATATIRDGEVVSVQLVDGGSGYTSAPTITVPGHPDARIDSTLHFGEDFATNGSVDSIVLRGGG